MSSCRRLPRTIRPCPTESCPGARACPARSRCSGKRGASFTNRKGCTWHQTRTRPWWAAVAGWVYKNPCSVDSSGGERLPTIRRAISGSSTCLTMSSCWAGLPMALVISWMVMASGTLRGAPRWRASACTRIRTAASDPWVPQPALGPRPAECDPRHREPMERRASRFAGCAPVTRSRARRELMPGGTIASHSRRRTGGTR